MKLPVRKPWLHVEVDEATPRPLPLRARSPRRGRCLEAARPLRAGLKPTPPPFGPAACWHRRIRGDTSLPKPRQWMLEEPFYMSSIVLEALESLLGKRVFEQYKKVSEARRESRLARSSRFRRSREVRLRAVHCSRSSERPLALRAVSPCANVWVESTASLCVWQNEKKLVRSLGDPPKPGTTSET